MITSVIGTYTKYPPIRSDSAEPIPPASIPYTGPRMIPARITIASPGWIYPPVPGVGIRMDIVATQANAANNAVIIIFFRLEFITKTLFPFVIAITVQ